MNSVVIEDIKKLISDFEFTNELSGKSIAITGATGLIGSLIIRFLDALNVEKKLNIAIFGIVRSLNKAARIPVVGNVEWIECELKDSIELNQSIDYIIHTASPTQSSYLANNPVEVIADTVIGAKNIFELAKAKNAVAIYLSSIEIYGQLFDKSCIHEMDYGYIDHLSPRSCYPMAKKLIECLAASYVNEYCVDIRIARLTQTLGAGVDVNDNRVFVQFAKAAISNRDIILHTKGLSSKNYIYTMDAINALFYILFKGKAGEAYNIANANTYISIKDLARFIIEVFNPDINLRFDIKDDMGYAPDTMVNLNVDKLDELGWKPKYDLEEIFGRLIRSIKEDLL